MVEQGHSEASTPEDLPVAVAQVISTEPPPLVAGCPFAHPRQPPLSIAHLLVWMFTSGVFLGLGRVAISSWATTDFDVPAWYRTLFQVEQVLGAPLCGVALFGLLLMAWRLVQRGPQFPAQPGHWLMVIYGFGTACAWGFGIAVDVLIPAIWDVRASADFLSWMQHALAYVVGGVTCSVAGWRLRDRWYWTLDLRVCGLLQLSIAAILWAQLVGGGFTWRIGSERVGWDLYLVGFFAIVLLVIAIYELGRGFSRDWLHWVGVALGLLLPTLRFLDALARRVLAHV